MVSVRIKEGSYSVGSSKSRGWVKITTRSGRLGSYCVTLVTVKGH